MRNWSTEFAVLLLLLLLKYREIWSVFFVLFSGSRNFDSVGFFVCVFLKLGFGGLI